MSTRIQQKDFGLTDEPQNDKPKHLGNKKSRKFLAKSNWIPWLKAIFFGIPFFCYTLFCHKSQRSAKESSFFLRIQDSYEQSFEV